MFKKQFPDCSCPEIRCQALRDILGGSSSSAEREQRLWKAINGLYGAELPLSPMQQTELQAKLLQLSETVSDKSPEFYKGLANICSSYNLDIAVLEAQSAAIEVSTNPEEKIILKLEMGTQFRQMKMYSPERQLYKEITQSILPNTRADANRLAILSACYADSFRAQRRICEADFAAHQAEQWRIAALNLP